MAVYTITIKDQASGAAKKITGGLSELIQEFAKGMAGGASFSEMLGGLSGSIDPVSLGLKVLSVAATATVGALVATSAAVVGLMANAISLSEANNDLKNKFQFLTGDGQGTVDMLSRMSKVLPFTKGELGSFAEGLAKAGLKGKDLESALEAAAAAEAALGAGGADKFNSVIKKILNAEDAGKNIKGLEKSLGELGIRLPEIAKQMGMTPAQLNAGLKAGKISSKDLVKSLEELTKAKGMDALEAKGLKFDTMMKKLKSNIKGLFADLGGPITGFMKEIKKLFEVFSKGGEGTKGTKSIVTEVFTSLFTIATAAVSGIRTAILYLIIAFAKVVVAVAPIVSAIKAFVNSSLGMNIIKGVLLGIAIVVGVLVIAFVILGAIIALPFIIMGLAVLQVIIAITLIYVAIMSLIDMFWSMGATIYDVVSGAIGTFVAWAASAAGIAGDFVAGLVQGLLGGIGTVVSAATKLASSAVNAVRNAMDSRSPSRIMMGIGTDVSDGLGIGMDDGTANVEKSASDMAGGAKTGVSTTLSRMSEGKEGQAASKSGGSKSGNQFIFNAGAFQISGGSAQEVLDLFEEQVAIIFEKLAMARAL
jgi:hypothetical protein